MVIDLYENITGKLEYDYLIFREGFAFSDVTYPPSICDGILLKFPKDVPCFSPRRRGSERTFEEHIELIKEYNIRKAYVIAENIDFLLDIPQLEYLTIVPADSSGNNFDYSPLYSMPRIRFLRANTVYGRKEELKTTIDYSKVKGLEDLFVVDDKTETKFEVVPTLKTLHLMQYRSRDLTNAFCSKLLDTLALYGGKITSLDGIEKAPKLKVMVLNRILGLKDITALTKVKSSLKCVRIDGCPKISDFSVLGELENLEYLSIRGNYQLPDLGFIRKLKNLKNFVFEGGNIIDGDLTPCRDLLHSWIHPIKRHYNMKRDELPDPGGFFQYMDGIDEWRKFWMG